MSRLRRFWHAYTTYTAESDARYVRGMAPVMVGMAAFCVLIGEWIGAAILVVPTLLALAIVRRKRSASS